MKRILIIEDERDIVKVVRHNLEREGFQVASAYDGSTGLAEAKKSPPHLLILDLMLPVLSGLDICREIRSDPKIKRLPILILTARSEEADRVVGLELGADDYVTKPFSPRELVARVKALLRRTEPSGEPEELLQIGRLTIDPNTYSLLRGHQRIPLTKREFDLIHFLASHPNKVFSREKLLDAVWGTDGFVTPRSVDAYVRRLRRKIEADPARPLCLKTIRGAGYLFDNTKS
ncbi:response regulator transcription factor [Acidobacteriia bacterium AH_259_A11_L15]|nr:response regulator transcription factor [Acidobacteriia bacterium AH_259_A11_L15]